MTRAQGVSQTLRNTRLAAIDFQAGWKTRKHKISMQLVLDTNKNVHLKISKFVPQQMTYYKTNIYYKMELTVLIKLMTQIVTDSRSQTGLYY